MTLNTDWVVGNHMITLQVGDLMGPLPGHIATVPSTTCFRDGRDGVLMKDRDLERWWVQEMIWNMYEDFGWGISYEGRNGKLLLMQHKQK